MSQLGAGDREAGSTGSNAGPFRCCASSSTWNAAWWTASTSRRPGSWERAGLLQRYRATIARFNAQRWREDLRLGGIDLMLNILVLLGYGGSFLLAALLLAEGSIDVGGFAVVIYAMSRLLMMTRAVTSMLGTSYRASATASHLIEFLQLDEGRPPGGDSDVPAAATLSAREVAFTYPGTEHAALSGVDLEVAAGTTLALVGANGAGKTTLAKLLLGLYLPRAGRVVRRGTDTREATRNGIRTGTSAVFQNYQRYQLSLRDNVILADAGAAGDEKRLLRALREGGVPEELWQGPDGLDVMLSREFGTRDLSLGQWQRLAIARGLFREHDTVLLDEPTAAIDPLEEQAVYERFMRIAAGRTAIIVTHRLGAARRPHPGPGRRPHRRRRHPRRTARAARPVPPHVHRPSRLVPQELTTRRTWVSSVAGFLVTVAHGAHGGGGKKVDAATVKALPYELPLRVA